MKCTILYNVSLLLLWLLIFFMSPVYVSKFIALSKKQLEHLYVNEFKGDVNNYALVLLTLAATAAAHYPIFIKYLAESEKTSYVTKLIVNLVLKSFNKFCAEFYRLKYILQRPVYIFYRNAYVKKITFFLRPKNYVKDLNFKNPYTKTLKFSLSSFYHGFKTFVVPAIISVLLLVILIDYYNINFIRQLAAWAIIGLIFFWLMSGFNFFLKRYRFGKFTSSIQRFWKRTNTYFWLIEGFLFSLFFYYYLNSSQEVFYFYDESNLNQNFLTSLSAFYLSSIILIFLIMYSLFLMLNLPSFTFKQNILHLKIITVLMVYIFLIECYQFYYVITMFSEIVWDFDNSANLWTLNWRTPKLRVKTQYLVLALIAKYWHFLFIFFSWLFLVLKSFEQKRIHYTLFGLNLQNCILLFILNILFNINWIHWIFRRFYDTTYFWFFVDYNNWFSEGLLKEFFIFFCNF